MATAVTRLSWTAGHSTVAILGAAGMLLGAGLTSGLVRAGQTGDASEIGRVLAGALVQLPAVWVLTGIAVALFGVAPRLIAGAWGALVLFS